MKDWSKRKGAEHTVQAVIARAAGKFASIKDAIIFPLNPPAIAELGNSTGFDFQLQDLAGLGHETLLAAQKQLLAMAATNPVVVGVRVQGLEDAAQLKIDVDEEQGQRAGRVAGRHQLDAANLFWFELREQFRQWQSRAAGDGPARRAVSHVAGRHARMSMSATARARWSRWPRSPRCAGFMVRRNCNTTTGFPPTNSSARRRRAKAPAKRWTRWKKWPKQLPAGIGYEWTGQSYEERLSGSQAPMLYALSLLVVFLCLAALYESWSIPLSVILVVPLGILGALLATKLRGLPNDVYFKVGLLTIVGLATKNAILIIEYAKDLQAAGQGT